MGERAARASARGRRQAARPRRGLSGGRLQAWVGRRHAERRAARGRVSWRWLGEWCQNGACWSGRGQARLRRAGPGTRPRLERSAGQRAGVRGAQRRPERGGGCSKRWRAAAQAEEERRGAARTSAHGRRTGGQARGTVQRFGLRNRWCASGVHGRRHRRVEVSSAGRSWSAGARQRGPRRREQ
jgi:hypothetical protein